METYLYSEYQDTLDIASDKISFKRLKDVTPQEKEQLIKMYITLFNQDNIELLAHLGTSGRTKDEGIWSNKPYTYKDGEEIISDYVSNDYIGVIAYSDSTKKQHYVLGCIVLQRRTKTKLENKGYVIQFVVPEDTEFWCEVDTFRRPITTVSGQLKNLASGLRSTTIELYKGINPALIYSSTNNPQMVASWRTDGFRVQERATTFGNKFQAFKLIV